MTTPTETITIENVVGSTGIDQELNLEQLGEDLAGVKYDPEQFPGLVYRTQNPNAAALIFWSGKIVCTGANSEEAVRESLSIVFDTMRELGIEVTETPPHQDPKHRRKRRLRHPIQSQRDRHRTWPRRCRV